MSGRVSVVVSTRNRPDQIVDCVLSILANPGDDFELVVIDQSDDGSSRVAVAAASDDSRLRWLPTDTRGLSASRNVALGATRAPVILFTDDDCRVPNDWVARVRAAFETEGGPALLFGAVVLRSEDRARGYAAEFEPARAREFQHGLPDLQAGWGVGANMAIRRAVFDRVGVFDLMLGAGAPFHAGEEIDLTIRALAVGFKVVHDPGIAVIHLGVREGPEASRLMRRYGVGLGATLAKHVRLRTPGALKLFAGWLMLHGRRSLWNLIRGHKNPGLGLVASVLLGAWRSSGLRIDRGQMLYESVSEKARRP
jgi:GT2 family glycosyltransferase